MASLALSYKIPVEKLALKYFPSGYREGKFFQLNEFYGEHAPLNGIHDHNLSFRYALSQAKALKHIQQKYSGIDGVIKQSGFINEESIDDAVAKAKQFIEEGYGCLKIKIGALSLDEEIEKVKMLQKELSDKIPLRLDLNKKYDLPSAQYFLHALKSCNIQYVEEPLKDTSKIFELRKKTKCNVALDESFTSIKDFSFMIESKINYLVIKPSRFSTIFCLIRFANIAKKLNIKLILSPCFETEFTGCTNAVLAFLLGLDDIHHGIYIRNFLKPLFNKGNDFLASTISISHAMSFLANFTPQESNFVEKICVS